MNDEPNESVFYTLMVFGVALRPIRCATLEQAKAAAVTEAKRCGCPVYVLRSEGVMTPGDTPVRWSETVENGQEVVTEP